MRRFRSAFFGTTLLWGMTGILGGTPAFALPEAKSQEANPHQDLERLAKHFRHLTHLEAKVEQTKTAPYLIRPLKTAASLTFDGKSVLWEIHQPVAEKIRITKEGISIAGAAGQGGQEVPRAAGFPPWIFSLLSGDLEGLKETFDVDYRGSRLRLTPKKSGKEPASGHGPAFGIESLTIDFTGPDEIKRIEIRAGDEVTTLRFSEVKARFAGEGR